MNNEFSIIICCYNSSLRLEPTLKHLSCLNTGGLSLEVILVDNLSTDGTSMIANELWGKFGNPFPLKIIKEEKQGLSFARHTGILNSNFELIVFCDDDNWLNPNYLVDAKNIMNENSNVAALGGFGIAISDVEFPDWFGRFKGGYAIGDENVISGVLPDDYNLTGAGLILRKILYLKAFETIPSLLSDRKGNQLSSGGDTEICLRLKLMGYKLYFANNLKFQHFIPKERLTESYRDRLFEGFTVYANIIQYYNLLLWAKKCSKICKILFLIKMILKLPFTSVGMFKRWSLKRDLMIFFVITGVRLIKLPRQWIQLYVWVNSSASKVVL